MTGTTFVDILSRYLQARSDWISADRPYAGWTYAFYVESVRDLEKAVDELIKEGDKP